MKELDYICKKYNVDLEDVKKRCDRINSIMSNLKIGDKFYTSNCWGDSFESEVLEIIDKDNGVVKVIEKGINSTNIMNVDDLSTREEMNSILKATYGTGLKDESE